MAVLCFVYLLNVIMVSCRMVWIFGWLVQKKKNFLKIIPYQLLASALWSKLLERHFSLALVCSYLVTFDEKNNCFRDKLLYRQFPGEFFPCRPTLFPALSHKMVVHSQNYETWIFLFFLLKVTVRCIHTFSCNAIVPVVTVILLFAWICFVFNSLQRDMSMYV